MFTFSLLQKENRAPIKRLVKIMLPLLVTQLAIMGMSFCDTAMSGQASGSDLAGVAIGSNVWMAVHTGLGGILLAALPLIANNLGANRPQTVTEILGQGCFLAGVFSFVLLSAGCIVLPNFYGSLGLTPSVYRIALFYSAGVGLGVLPFFVTAILRSLVDSLGYTRLTMRLYLMTLPINALLNYVLIFGKLGLPPLGGIGAGLATGLTFWLLCLLYCWVVLTLAPFKNYLQGFSLRPCFSRLREYLSVGLPMGVSIFLESSIFAVMAFFIAKFGTAVIAAHQAAINFASLIYMVPYSFSLSLTICVGVEYGAKNFQEVRRYASLGLRLSLLVATCYTLAEACNIDAIIALYDQPLARTFLIYSLFWQYSDAVAAPIQGILRGLKDVKAPFYSSLLAYWGICLPLGLVLDYLVGQGPYAYWQSIILGVAASAVILSLRLHRWRKKLREEGSSS